MNDLPIGFFDSGVGGLTVLDAVQKLLPHENLLYLGDTARLPYGSKSPETIRQFADEDIRFLIEKNVKAVVIACNTATAHALHHLQEKYRIPILGVIQPGVEAVLEDPQAQRIGIIATRGTIRSHAYQHSLALKRTGLLIHAVAAPLLVPLIEENWVKEEVTRSVLEKYLQPLLAKGIDTLMLACTHYPLLMPQLQGILPPHIRVVDSATTCAKQLKAMLQDLNLLSIAEEKGTLELYLTDLSEEFETLVQQFLTHAPQLIHRAVLTP